LSPSKTEVLKQPLWCLFSSSLRAEKVFVKERFRQGSAFRNLLNSGSLSQKPKFWNSLVLPNVIAAVPLFPMGINNLLWYSVFMGSFRPALFLLPALFFASCVQLPPVDNDEPVVAATENFVAEYRYYYRFEINSRTAGFSLLLNGSELVFFEGGSSYSGSVLLNDWMVSGENEFSITVFSPENGRVSASCSFVLKKQDIADGAESVLYTLDWPGSSGETMLDVTEYFTPENFPAALMEKAERVISATGNLPMADQREITSIVQKLREAFTVKDIGTVNVLMETKNADLAAVRFLPLEECRAASEAFFVDLMNRADFSVRPLNGHYSFLSTADDRLVKVMQGRVGFPEAAIILEYRDDNGKKARHEQDLYVAKIDGSWVIIR
jgi:hypothetical protein